MVMNAWNGIIHLLYAMRREFDKTSLAFTRVRTINVMSIYLGPNPCQYVSSMLARIKLGHCCVYLLNQRRDECGLSASHRLGHVCGYCAGLRGAAGRQSLVRFHLLDAVKK